MLLQRLTRCIGFLPEDIIQKIVQLLQKVGDQWEEEVRSELSAQTPRGMLPSLLLAQTLPVLPGLAAPLLWSLSPAVPGATLKPSVASWGAFPSPEGQGPGSASLSSLPQQHQALHSVVTRRNAGPVVKKKSQEKMSSLKRAFSFKKYGPEEPKRAGAAHVSSPESRPPKRPNFLPLCVGGHRPSSSSLPGEQAHGYHSNTASRAGTFPMA